MKKKNSRLELNRTKVKFIKAPLTKEEREIFVKYRNEASEYYDCYLDEILDTLNNHMLDLESRSVRCLEKIYRYCTEITDISAEAVEANLKDIIKELDLKENKIAVKESIKEAKERFEEKADNQVKDLIEQHGIDLAACISAKLILDLSNKQNESKCYVDGSFRAITDYAIEYSHQISVAINDLIKSIDKENIAEVEDEEIAKKDFRYKDMTWREYNSMASDKGFKYIRSNGDHGIFKKNSKIIIIPQGRRIGKGLQLVLQNQLGIM